MSKIYVRTITYNNEDVIARAIESILNQTHSNWVYYICNNGSTDTTGEIIEEYAKKDNRIKTFHNKENFPYTGKFLEIGHNLNDNEYLCILDGDDSYNIDFMEKTLALAKKENLDFVISSTDMFHSNGNITTRQFKDLIVTKENFIQLMYEFYNRMTAMWGKLYRGDLLRKCTTLNEELIDYLGTTWDSYFVREALENSLRSGFMSYSGYKYYITNKNSTFTSFNPNNLNGCNILYNQSAEILETKAKKAISEEEIIFILDDYCQHLAYHVKSLSEYPNQLSDIKKLELINQVLRFEYLKLATENKIGHSNSVLNEIGEFLGKLNNTMGGLKQYKNVLGKYNRLCKLFNN